jgi:hypothetical protein
MISIRVDEEEVRVMADTFSREPKTWDELVWLLAEAELRLRPALDGGILYQRGLESREVDLDPDRIVDQPDEAAIRQLAGEIASLGPPLQDLHWLIAERRYIFSRVKAAT